MTARKTILRRFLAVGMSAPAAQYMEAFLPSAAALELEAERALAHRMREWKLIALDFEVIEGIYHFATESEGKEWSGPEAAAP